MKKLLSIFLISLWSVNSYSQINYENGYFITNEGSRTSCFIKNTDWKNNPKEFTYKLSESSEVLKADIKTVKEFGISDFTKYKCFTVDIDSSSEEINHLSTNRNPEFSKEQLFLKVLVEGKATLFYFEKGNFSKYFYAMDGSNAKQLIFKSYLNSESEIQENNSFKQQLLNDLKCDKLTSADIERIKYRIGDLTRIFKLYNECQNSESIEFEEKTKRDIFNLSVRPGLNLSSLQINSPDNDINIDFGSKLTFSLGVEAESIMPFNKSKWSLIAEPTFQYFKSENTTNGHYFAIDYKSIDLPLGIRYYMFLNDYSKIHIDALYIVNFDLNSEITTVSGTWTKINATPNLAFGIGYNLKNKYSFEMRYGLRRDLIPNSSYYSNYKTFSIILGYNIL